MRRTFAAFCRFAFFLSALSLGSNVVLAQSQPKANLELNPVLVHIDEQDRIHIAYQKQCGSTFAGIVLRPSGENDLYVAVSTLRPNVRCLELSGVDELIIPHLKGSDFAKIRSLNPALEAIFFRLSPIQNFNIYKDGAERSLEAGYTSQCGTASGLNIFPGAKGLEISVIEGRNSRFESCTRSTKLIRYAGLDFSHAKLRAQQRFSDEYENERYTLRRAKTRLIAQGKAKRLYFLRRCNEAPVGLVRSANARGPVFSVLLAHYPDQACAPQSAAWLWTPWQDLIQEPKAQAFTGPSPKERLSIKRPSSYQTENDRLSVNTYVSCHKDIGLVARQLGEGYALGILQIESSKPCNSPMKEVSYSYDWNWSRASKRVVKPLQLVGL